MEPSRNEVAFLLKENGDIEKLRVPSPCASVGTACDLGTDQWVAFVEAQLQYFDKNVGHEDLFRQTGTQWDLSFPRRVTRTWLPGFTYNLVKIYCYPYLGVDHFQHVLKFNHCAPLFSNSPNWRGDMLLVCYQWHLEHDSNHGQIVHPSEVLSQIPEVEQDFWCHDFKMFQEMQLAFAMITHNRLGTQACAQVLDYNLVRMILETTIPIRSEDTWDLRGIFHAMNKIEQDYSHDEHDGSATPPLSTSADDADCLHDADSSLI